MNKKTSKNICMYVSIYVNISLSFELTENAPYIKLQNKNIS